MQLQLAHDLHAAALWEVFRAMGLSAGFHQQTTLRSHMLWAVHLQQLASQQVTLCSRMREAAHLQQLAHGVEGGGLLRPLLRQRQQPRHQLQQVLVQLRHVRPRPPVAHVHMHMVLSKLAPSAR